MSVCEKRSVLQGLRAGSVLETDALLLSSLSFDLQRQGSQACDFQISGLLSCGSMSLSEDVYKAAKVPKVGKGVLGPQGLLAVGVLECLGCAFYSPQAFLSPSVNNPASIQALQG